MNSTDCTSGHDDVQLLFSFFSRKRVVADFAGGELTSDAGLPLLRQLDERLGLSRRWLWCLEDRRHLGSPRILLFPRVPLIRLTSRPTASHPSRGRNSRRLRALHYT